MVALNELTGIAKNKKSAGQYRLKREQQSEKVTPIARIILTIHIILSVLQKTNPCYDTITML